MARETHTDETANRRIQQIEEKYDLLQYQIDGWCVWPLLRFYVFMRLLNLSLENRLAWQTNKRLLVSLKETTKFIHLMHLRDIQYCVISPSSARSEKIDGLYRDVFFDDLLAEIGYYFKIERVNKENILPTEKTFIKSDINTTATELLPAVLARTFRSKHVSNMARDMHMAINSAFGKEIIPLDRISHHFQVFSWRRKFYSYLLSRIKPQFLMVNCAYSGNHPIVAAAKECDITVIEFQHGVLGEHHPGYSWTEHACSYKSEMPIPDYIFLYGEYWKQRLRMNKFWQLDELRVVGSLRMEQYRQKQRTYRRDGKCILTLTTQGIVTENLIEFITEFLNIAGGQLDFELTVKLHPGEESKEIYQASLEHNPHVRILLNKEEPSTFSLLISSDLHISINSTVHFEALALGIPTVILPLDAFGQISEFKEDSGVYVAETPQKLLDIALCYKDIKVKSDISEFLFKLGALENMKKELNLLQSVKSGRSCCAA